MTSAQQNPNTTYKITIFQAGLQQAREIVDVPMNQIVEFERWLENPNSQIFKFHGSYWTAAVIAGQISGYSYRIYSENS